MKSKGENMIVETRVSVNFKFTEVIKEENIDKVNEKLCDKEQIEKNKKDMYNYIVDALDLDGSGVTINNISIDVVKLDN